MSFRRGGFVQPAADPALALSLANPTRSFLPTLSGSSKSALLSSFALGRRSFYERMRTMIRKKKVAAFARASLVLLLVFGIGVKSTGAGQIVSGSYSVKESTESGTQVRVTLGIRLSNAGEQ